MDELKQRLTILEQQGEKYADRFEKVEDSMRSLENEVAGLTTSTAMQNQALARIEAGLFDMNAGLVVKVDRLVTAASATKEIEAEKKQDGRRKADQLWDTLYKPAIVFAIVGGLGGIVAIIKSWFKEH